MSCSCVKWTRLPSLDDTFMRTNLIGWRLRQRSRPLEHTNSHAFQAQSSNLDALLTLTSGAKRIVCNVSQADYLTNTKLLQSTLRVNTLEYAWTTHGSAYRAYVNTINMKMRLTELAARWWSMPQVTSQTSCKMDRLRAGGHALCRLWTCRQAV